MRIGIDLQVLAHRPPTGIGKYCWHLAKQLAKLESAHQFIFFIPSSSENTDIGEIKQSGAEVVVLPEKKIPFLSGHWMYAKIMEKEKLDVLHGPVNTTPLFYHGKTIITIHDLAIYKHPEWFPSHQWLSTKILVPRSIKRAHRIIAPSEATARDLKELFKVPDKKIIVIPLGVEANKHKVSSIKYEDSAEHQKLNTNVYILFVGTLEPRKNVERLIEAYGALPEQIKSKYELLLAGSQGSREYGDNLKFKILNLKLEKKVRILGYVEDAELAELYKNAALFVYPSLYEGFGLPILEAMAAGVPVVTSNVSSMPEVAGGAAELVDPYNTGEISSAIARLIRDVAYSRELSRRGLERARQFSWYRTARETLETYEA